MKPRFAGAFLLAAVLALCGTAFAHHGNVAYMDKTIDVKHGTVTKFIWTNPHSFIMFDATNDKGEVEHWAVEAGSPSALTPRGWTKNSVKVGDTIDVAVFQARNGNTVGRLARIVLSDGKTLHDSQDRDTQPAAGEGGSN
jgi:Family of unknown function (DUF6152)